MNQELKKRLKSFGWRLGGMVAAAVVAFLAANLELFELPPEVTVIVGLVLGEITKSLNNRFGSIKN